MHSIRFIPSGEDFLVYGAIESIQLSNSNEFNYPKWFNAALGVRQSPRQPLTRTSPDCDKNSNLNNAIDDFFPPRRNMKCWNRWIGTQKLKYQIF